MSNYPKRRSRVTVEFTDGEIRHYEISAGASLANYLNQELQSGALRLSDYDQGKAVVIPSHQIKQVEIAELPARYCNRQVEDQDEDRAISLTDPITDLDLPPRAEKLLLQEGITTVAALLQHDERSLFRIPGMGPKSTDETMTVIRYLKDLGLKA